MAHRDASMSCEAGRVKLSVTLSLYPSDITATWTLSGPITILLPGAMVDGVLDARSLEKIIMF